MRIRKQARQYWPLTVVTMALVWGLPFLTAHGEKRPGLAGLTGHSKSLERELEELSYEAQGKPHGGFSRAPGVAPFYGFDGLSLDAPVFRSWWEGKSSTAGAKLKELRANTVVLGPIWKDTIRFHDTVARMHGNGVKVIVQVSDVQDWIDLAEDAHGRAHPVPNTFVVGRASHLLAQARNHGVGKFADFVMIGGDAMSYATQAQRQQMYQIVKQYFHGVPIVRRYGADLLKAEAMQDKAHPMGGTWDEYRFGADECDIALVGVGRGLDESRAGVRINAALEELNHAVSIVKSRSADTAIIVSAQFGDEKMLSNTRSAMWSPKEIDQFVSAMLTSSGVEGLLMKGLGQQTYDLGFPEFAAQRQAFKNAAPLLSSDEAATQALSTAADRGPAGIHTN